MIKFIVLGFFLAVTVAAQSDFSAEVLLAPTNVDPVADLDPSAEKLLAPIDADLHANAANALENELIATSDGEKTGFGGSRRRRWFRVKKTLKGWGRVMKTLKKSKKTLKGWGRVTKTLKKWGGRIRRSAAKIAEKAAAIKSKVAAVAAKALSELFRASCSKTVPLNLYPEHEELFKQFPKLRGENFTCSCNSYFQFVQIEQFLGKLEPQGKTETCAAKKSLPKFYLAAATKWCQKQKTVQSCMAFPKLCHDEAAADKRKHVDTLLDGLLCCVEKKCATCPHGRLASKRKDPSGSSRRLLAEEELEELIELEDFHIGRRCAGCKMWPVA